MKTDKWKLIVIKDPRLRKARKNLRTLLRLAYSAELDRLSNLERLYQQRRIKGRKLTPSQRKREIMLSRLGDELMHAYSRSILRCGSGSLCESQAERNLPVHEVSLDVDMAWNPVDKRWYCSACYNYHFNTSYAKKTFKRAMQKEKKLDDYLTEKFGLDQKLTKEEERVLGEFMIKFEDLEEELKKTNNVDKKKTLIKNFIGRDINNP